MKERGLLDKPVITMLNKRDLVPDAARLKLLESSYPPAVAISAAKGEGIETLFQRLRQHLPAPDPALSS